MDESKPIARVVKVLERLAERGHDGCSVQVLAKETGVPYGAVRRILLALQDCKWAVASRASQSNANIWVIGPKLSRIASAYRTDAMQRLAALEQEFSSITGEDLINEKHQH